jgi:3-hydroxybutyrate dehydrogenase
MLKNKTALVTGSTSGIGLGIARALAAQGCNIMLNGFGDAGTIEIIRAGLEKEHGVRVAYHGADLSQPEQIEDLVAITAKTFGGVDVLCNNAGIQFVAPVDEFPPERWDQILAVNLSSAFHTIHHALPHMKRAGWGRIINTASAHGLVASVNKVAYVAAKHGIVGLTKVVALETAGSGITCNAVAPGWVRTELVEKQITARAQQLGLSQEDAAINLLTEKQPSKQFVSVEQLGGIVVFLCSEAANQITGTTLSADGGWTAQ